MSPRPVWWDADPQKEVILDGAVRDWNGPAIQPIEGRVIAVDGLSRAITGKR